MWKRKLRNQKFSVFRNLYIAFCTPRISFQIPVFPKFPFEKKKKKWYANSVQNLTEINFHTINLQVCVCFFFSQFLNGSQSRFQYVKFFTAIPFISLYFFLIHNGSGAKVVKAHLTQLVYLNWPCKKWNY